MGFWEPNLGSGAVPQAGGPLICPSTAVASGFLPLIILFLFVCLFYFIVNFYLNCFHYCKIIVKYNYHILCFI